MKIGRYYIEKKFWYILGFIFLIVFGLFYLNGRKPAPYDPYVDPAFAPNKVAKLQHNWLDPYISEYGAQFPDTIDAFTTYYPTNIGTPMKFRAYLPLPEESQNRAGLTFNKYGWQFGPAIFLDPNQSLTPESLSDLTSTVLDDQPLEIGFEAGTAPARGTAYEITGLLYWLSKTMNPPPEGSPEREYAKTSPVILATNARALSGNELTNPTTHYADLDITYQQNDMQLELSRIEWSSGSQVRLCTTITSTSKSSVASWGGLSEFNAEYPQAAGNSSSAAQADDTSPIGMLDMMTPGTKNTGYLLFEIPPAAAPTSGLRLFVPPLNQSGEGALTTIEVKPKQFKSINTNNKDAAANINRC